MNRFLGSLKVFKFGLRSYYPNKEGPMEQRLETKAIFFAVVGIGVNNSTSPTTITLLMATTLLYSVWQVEACPS